MGDRDSDYRKVYKARRPQPEPKPKTGIEITTPGVIDMSRQPNSRVLPPPAGEKIS